MKFNIWKYNSKVQSSISEDLAIHRAKQRHGLNGLYKAYEAI